MTRHVLAFPVLFLLVLVMAPWHPALSQPSSDRLTASADFDPAFFAGISQQVAAAGDIPILAQADPALQPGGFIEVSGSQLMRLGQPVRLKGVNYYPQGRPWAEMWTAWDAHQIERELRLARDQLGINTVRILLPFEESYDDSKHHRVRTHALNKLRELTQIAGNLDIRLIIALFDFYNDFPLPGTAQEQDNFIYLQTLLGNFGGDDRIMAWDIHNEPDHYPMWTDGDAQRVLGWLGRMADEIHRIAPNHLVTVGMGQYDNFWQPGPDGRRVIDYSDFVSVHIYNAPDAIRQLDELRRHTSKPIVLQEFGWPTGPKCSVRDYTEDSQAQVYRSMLAAAESRVAGIISWTLRDYHAGPTRRWDTREEHYGLYRPDDSLKPAGELFRTYAASPLPSWHTTSLPLTTDNPRPPGGEKGPLYIAETGHYVKDWFRIAWDHLGGQVSFGYPLSEAFVRPSDNRVVQYFQGATLELISEGDAHPNFPYMTDAERAMVMLRPVDIGRMATSGRIFPQGVNVPPGGRFYPETGYTIGGAFLGFYDGVAGYWRLGLPLSEEVVEEINGVPTLVQYFERGRLEWNNTAITVDMGHLGIWAWDMQCQFTP